MVFEYSRFRFKLQINVHDFIYKRHKHNDFDQFIVNVRSKKSLSISEFPTFSHILKHKNRDDEFGFVVDCLFPQ